MSESALQRERLGFGTRLAFAGQGFMAAAMGLMVAVHLPKFYTDVILLPAGLLAIGVAVARALDAITDPIMGWISDHTRSRWGRRRPWIAAGVLGNAVAYYFLLVPPEGLGASVMWWFGAWFLVSFLCITLVAIPRAALAVELTLDGTERQKLYGTIAFFVALGLVAGAVMPRVLAEQGIGDPRRAMKVIAGTHVVGYLLLNGVFLAFVKERREFATRGHHPFVPGFRRALRSRPFAIMFTSHVITAIPIAIPATLMPFYVTYVMKSPRPIETIALLLVAYLGSGFLAVPLWMLLARRMGKLRCWLAASFVGVTGGAAWFFIGPGDERLAVLLQIYVGTQASVWLFLGGAMHADIVDYDELHTGKRREAQYSALWSIIPKFALIPGASIPVAILAASGYVPNQPQTPEVVSTLRVLFSLVPAGFNALGLSLMWWYPLTEAVHADVRRGIAAHERGETARDPITGADVPPQSARELDEREAWLLDTFSVRELRHAIAHGATVLVRGVVIRIAAMGAASVTGAVAAIHLVTDAERDAGVGPALCIVLSGLALAATLFHALRVRPALALARQGLDGAVVQRHLAEVARLRGEIASAPQR